MPNFWIMALTLNSNAPFDSEVFSLHMNEINPFFLCPLCNGYLVDALTISSCVHSFCRSCLFRHLKSPLELPESTSLDFEIFPTLLCAPYDSRPRRSSTSSLSTLLCPLCEKSFDPTNVFQDNSLQHLIYKLVPQLHERETKRRQEFAHCSFGTIHVFSTFSVDLIPLLIFLLLIKFPNLAIIFSFVKPFIFFWDGYNNLVYLAGGTLPIIKANDEVFKRDVKGGQLVGIVIV